MGGGTIPMLSPTLKSGDGRVPPPRPHRSTPVWQRITQDRQMWKQQASPIHGTLSLYTDGDELKHIIFYVTGNINTHHRPSAILKWPLKFTLSSYGNNVYISGKDNV